MWINLADTFIQDVIVALQEASKQQLADQLQRDRDQFSNRDETEQAYLNVARKMYGSDGDLEFDDGAVVSLSDDPGAYVMAWKWITDEEAGIKNDKDDEA